MSHAIAVSCAAEVLSTKAGMTSFLMPKCSVLAAGLALEADLRAARLDFSKRPDSGVDNQHGTEQHTNQEQN